MSVFQFFKQYFHYLKYPFFVGLFIVGAGDVLGRVGAYFGAKMIDVIGQNASRPMQAFHTVVFLMVLYILFTLVRFIIINMIDLFASKYIPFVKGKISCDLFDKVHTQAPAYFEKEMSGNISSKLNNIIDCFEELYFGFFWTTCQPLLSISVITLGIVLVSPVIGFILVFTLAGFFVLMYYNSLRIVKLKKEQSRLFSLTAGNIIDSVTNAETVKSFAHEGYEQQHLLRTMRQGAAIEKITLAKTSSIRCWQGVSRSVLQFVCALIPLLFWYYDKLSFTDYLFIQSSALALLYQTGSVLDDLVHLISDSAVMQEGLNLLYRDIVLPENKSAPDLTVSKGDIFIDGITFAYEKNKKIFKNFSLTLHAGEKVGLIGYSGSGKSSLIKLLNRMYDVQKGQILIDGQDIKIISQKSLHKAISYIPQEPVLLNRTILENIRYSRPSATEQEVVAAAKQAHIHDFILTLPNGYESKVGERGVMLSGGQRQRIAIARAILKNAPILILDEATSALDSESEMLIQKSLAALMKGKTVIAIAHRLSTLKKMDKIITLDKGKMIESGTHAALMKNKGVYYSFYKIQSTHFIGE